jgi:hypothetical protein
MRVVSFGRIQLRSFSILAGFAALREVVVASSISIAPGRQAITGQNSKSEYRNPKQTKDFNPITKREIQNEFVHNLF